MRRKKCSRFFSAAAAILAAAVIAAAAPSQARAAEIAKKIGVSFNDLAAAAINKICRDYESQER